MAYACEIIISRQKISDYLTDQKYNYIYIIGTMPLKHGVWVGYILINTTNPNPIPDPNHRTEGRIASQQSCNGVRQRTISHSVLSLIDVLILAILLVRIPTKNGVEGA